MEEKLDYEKLDVYQCALDLLARVRLILQHIPRLERELRDQLDRSAMSIPLNIAEAAGKPTAADRARFHAIARGSAMECAAVLDVIRIARHAPTKELAEAKVLLVRIVSMLSKMCR